MPAALSMHMLCLVYKTLLLGSLVLYCASHYVDVKTRSLFFLQDLADKLDLDKLVLYKTWLMSFMLVLACSFSFIITLSRHLMLVYRTGGHQQDTVDVAMFLIGCVICEGGAVYMTKQMCCMLVVTSLFSFSPTLSRPSMRVYHIGGLVQDMVDVLHTGAGHFSTKLSRHSMLVH